jgi:hypothetical protein
MPVRLWRRLGLLWLIADMLWGYLDFAWGNQLHAASFGACRCHVRSVKPMVIRVSDVPIGFSPFALSELGYQFFGCDMLSVLRMPLFVFKAEQRKRPAPKHVRIVESRRHKPFMDKLLPIACVQFVQPNI